MSDGCEIYAFKSIRTGKFITGTDKRVSPHRQIMNPYHPPLLVVQQNLVIERIVRGIRPVSYKAVRVKITEVDA